MFLDIKIGSVWVLTGAAKSNCDPHCQLKSSAARMAPKGSVSRKEKRKNERDEKKRNRNKRQRRDEPQVSLQKPNRPAGASRDGGNNRKRPQSHQKPNTSRIQNKFHELLQETTGLSSTLRAASTCCRFVATSHLFDYRSETWERSAQPRGPGDQGSGKKFGHFFGVWQSDGSEQAEKVRVRLMQIVWMC